MITPNPLAVRVARRHAARHQAAIVLRNVPSTTRIEIGTTYGIEAKIIVEPTTGYLSSFRFRKALDGTTIPWEGVGVDGKVVKGKILLHATVAEDHVATWAEVTVDP